VGTTGVTYTTDGSMSNYIWSVSAGGTVTGGGTTSSNFVTVTWNTAGAQTITVNYTDGFGCTALSATLYNVTVNPLPVPTITGTTSLCVGTTGVIYTSQTGMTKLPVGRIRRRNDHRRRHLFRQYRHGFLEHRRSPIGIGQLRECQRMHSNCACELSRYC